MNDDAGLDERVDELGRSQKVRLIGWNDETARIAPVRATHQFVELGERNATASAKTTATTATAGRRIRRCIATSNGITATGTTAATTTAATAASHISACRGLNF